MKTLRKILKLTTLALICLGALTPSLHGDSPQRVPKPAANEPPPAPVRAVPFRGIVGKIDLKNQTFTLKNKSNKLIRVFKVTPETRFELDKQKKTLKDLTVDQQVRGSCIKTGDRMYNAKLVRWNSPTKSPTPPENLKEKPTQ